MKKLILLPGAGALLFILYMMGTAQDAQFAKQQALFEQQQTAYEAGHFEQAYEIGLTILEETESERVYYVTGIAAATLGKTEQAQSFLEQSLTLNPHHVKQASFMLQYAEILLMNEESALAKSVLLRCQQLQHDDNQQQFAARVAELLLYIEQVNT